MKNRTVTVIGATGFLGRHTVRALAKQRFRWAYGTLQCLWKYRGITFSPSHGELGMVAPGRDQVVLAREFVAGGSGTSRAVPARTAAMDRGTMGERVLRR